ncbi:MAG TPA: DUF5985 family protein [Candidatus Aquilonibacter sp.]|nr:DUF5985 family protein [Candidatus Aquilonibacter sp.]
MLIEGFSLGFVATASLVAAVFFLRFWTRTRDFLFLAFAISFGAEAVTRTIMALKDIPDTNYSWVFVERLFEYLFILFAILRKNRKAG